MKNKIYERYSAFWLLSLYVLLSSCFLISCEKDKMDQRYFELQDNEAKVEIMANGATQTYTFRSNGDWEIKPVRQEDWVKVEPLSGSGDGTFTITVDKNRTEEDRNFALTFKVNGQRQSNVFMLEQKARAVDDGDKEQYIYLDGFTESLDIPIAGGSNRFIMRATGKWRIKTQDLADWLSIVPMEGEGDTPVMITVSKNSDEERESELLFFLNDIPQSETVALHQKGVDLSLTPVFEERFDWLQYGSAVFYDTKGETRYDSWNETNGWSSSVNTAENKTPLTYARQGFVKLGKTNYGGDLITPKLANVKGTKDLIVKFKAVPYKTAAGTKDATSLKVNLIGPGTLSVFEFDVNNWPNYDLDPNCTEIWKEAQTERSFVISGATADTQIRFLGGEYDLRENGINKNRIFLDDIVVTIKK